MIKILNYYVKYELLSEYIKLYVKYITEDKIPCSTFDKYGNLVMSYMDRETFKLILSKLNEVYRNIYLR